MDDALRPCVVLVQERWGGWGGFLAYKAAERAGGKPTAVVPRLGVRYGLTVQGVGPIQAPVLAIYGEKDPSVPSAQIDKIRALFQETSKAYEVLTYPAMLSSIRRRVWVMRRRGARARAVQFLKDHLGMPPAPPSAP